MYQFNNSFFNYVLFRPGFLTFAAAASSSYEVKCNNYYRSLLDKVSCAIAFFQWS